MILDEAIKILEDLGDELNYPGLEADRPAIQLGIEALKRCRELKKYTVPADYMPLPGETKD